MGRRSFLDRRPDLIPLLGKVPDQEIADKAKITRIAVGNARRKRGVKAYKRPTGAALRAVALSDADAIWGDG